MTKTKTAPAKTERLVKLASISTDRARERDGEWVSIPDLPGVELKVRSSNYPAFDTAWKITQQRLVRQYGKKPIPDEVAVQETGSLYAEHILLDWKGFDEPFEASRVQVLLTNPAYRDLLQHVVWAATQVGRREIEFVEEAVGNSGGAASGNSA